MCLQTIQRCFLSRSFKAWFDAIGLKWFPQTLQAFKHQTDDGIFNIRGLKYKMKWFLWKAWHFGVLEDFSDQWIFCRLRVIVHVINHFEEVSFVDVFSFNDSEALSILS